MIRQAFRTLLRSGSGFARDRRGITVVEFAIVAPVMLLTLMGLGDLMYQGYVQAILEGAVQKAGRDSAIQGGAESAALIDRKVERVVKEVAKNARFTPSRLSYERFSRIRPEPFRDANGNKTRDAGECFDDENGNATWDQNPGRDSQGGAHDVTVYTMTVTYPRLFPMAGLLGWPQENKLKASTLLKNQPYERQVIHPVVEVCS